MGKTLTDRLRTALQPLKSFFSRHSTLLPPHRMIGFIILFYGIIEIREIIWFIPSIISDFPPSLDRYNWIGWALIFCQVFFFMVLALDLLASPRPSRRRHVLEGSIILLLQGIWLVMCVLTYIPAWIGWVELIELKTSKIFIICNGIQMIAEVVMACSILYLSGALIISRPVFSKNTYLASLIYCSFLAIMEISGLGFILWWVLMVGTPILDMVHNLIRRTDIIVYVLIAYFAYSLYRGKPLPSTPAGKTTLPFYVRIAIAFYGLYTIITFLIGTLPWSVVYTIVYGCTIILAAFYPWRLKTYAR